MQTKKSSQNFQVKGVKRNSQIIKSSYEVDKSKNLRKKSKIEREILKKLSDQLVMTYDFFVIAWFFSQSFSADANAVNYENGEECISCMFLKR